MKYEHNFVLEEDGKDYRLYREGDHLVRLDFTKDFLRVAIFEKKAELFPTYSICPGELEMPRHGRERLSREGFSLITPSFQSKDGIDSFQIHGYDFEINLRNFRIKCSKGGKVLFQDREYISYNFEHELGEGSYHYLSREEDEHIYGLGDKTGPINKNKRHYRLETFDAMGFDANSSDPLYKQVPFYICKNSVGSYGIYYDTYSTGYLDFGCEKNNYYGIYKSAHFEEESLIYYVFFGEVPEILHSFSYLCGKNFFPPKWSLKYCGSSMNYTDADNADEALRGFVALCKKYDLDVGGYYLSSGYTQIGSQRCVFHWNQDKIPSPEGLAAYFKENGIEFLPNIKPAFLTTHPLYESIAQKGWFLHYEDGSPAKFPFWGGYGSYLDFTNDKTFEFWTTCVKKQLIDKGYKNPWNDNNEYDIHDASVWADGFGKPIQAIKIRPLFSMLMSMASLDAQDKSVRHMAVSRSGIAGMQRIVETWTGDNNTSFDDFRGNHKMAMTMSLSGFYNFGSDIGGFAGPRPEKELFLRWIQYGSFLPRFTLHSWNPDGTSTMPWLYEDCMDAVKACFNFRKHILPYLYNVLYRSVENYIPMISPLFLNYPDYDEESDLFLLGDSILACPIFDEGVRQIQVKLPKTKGGWYLEKKRFEGKLLLDVPLKSGPKYFVKAGSLLPVDENGIAFEIYPLDEGEFRYDYYEDDGISLAKGKTYSFAVNCFKDHIEVQTNYPNPKFILVDEEKRPLKIR